MQSRMPYAHREISAAPHLVCSFLWLLVVWEFERNSKAGRTKGIDQSKNKVVCTPHRMFLESWGSRIRAAQVRWLFLGFIVPHDGCTELCCLCFSPLQKWNRLKP